MDDSLEWEIQERSSNPSRVHYIHLDASTLSWIEKRSKKVRRSVSHPPLSIHIRSAFRLFTVSYFHFRCTISSFLLSLSIYNFFSSLAIFNLFLCLFFPVLNILFQDELLFFLWSFLHFHIMKFSMSVQI